jgi:anti-anti-sigma factor
MAEQFSVTIRQDGGMVVVALAGELDLATAPELGDALESLDADATVDLSGVTFMDCAGLAVLLEAHEREGRRVQVTGAHGLTLRMMVVLGVDAILSDRRVTPDGTAG